MLYKHNFKCKAIIAILLKLDKKNIWIKKLYYICDVIKMLREENKLRDLQNTISYGFIY